VYGALQGDREQLLAIPLGLRDHAHDDQLVTDRKVVLQRLAEPSNLAGALTEDDRLVDVVLFQLCADELNVRSQQLEQLQARFRGDAQLVELDQRLIELSRGFADVGFGQPGKPACYPANAGVAEGQALPSRCGCAQQQMVALSIQNGRAPRRLRA